MRQLPDGEDWFHLVDEVEPGEQVHPVTSALLQYEAWRARSSSHGAAGSMARASEESVALREADGARVLNDLHDLLPEAEQLRLYRFFLTSVRRTSVIGTRFDPAIMVSPDRSRAIEAEFDDLTHDLDQMLMETAMHSTSSDAAGAKRQAAAFMWSMTWWVHGRRDVTHFVFDPTQDPDVLLVLGRCPDSHERMSADIYLQACMAELEHRNQTKEARRNEEVDQRPPRSRKRVKAVRSDHADEGCHL